MFSDYEFEKDELIKDWHESIMILKLELSHLRKEILKLDLLKTKIQKHQIKGRIRLEEHKEKLEAEK